jgi:hypothetical protein
MSQEKSPGISKKIAFFVGSDISSYLLVAECVPQLIELGVTPFIFFPKHLVKPGRVLLPELQELGFYERTVANSIIYPCLDEYGGEQDQRVLTPHQLAKKYSLEVSEVENINDSKFVALLREREISAGVSVRCYQKFGDDVISYFSEHNKALWNLHPGILPQYRGVMTAIRAMNNGDLFHGYTLHEINKGWDAGGVIETGKLEIDYSKSMLENLLALRPIGVSLVLAYLKLFLGGSDVVAHPQKEHERRYYSFPTETEFKFYREKGINLLDAKVMADFYVSCFVKPNTEIESKLRARLAEVLMHWHHQYEMEK